MVPFTGWEDTDQLFIMGYTGDSSVAEFYDFEGEFFSEISALNGLLDGVSAGDAEFADFDGNGELDMFITGYNSVNDSIADFYFNYKTGLDPVVYKNQKPAIEGFNSGRLFPFDFDLDGDQDVFCLRGGDAGRVNSVLYELDNGQFKARYDHGIPQVGGMNGTGMAIGDVNNDGYIDIIVSSNFDSTSVSLTMINNSGNGTFSVSSSPDNLPYHSNIDLGDVNEDGNLDAIFSTNPGSSLFFGDGSGGFTESGLSSSFPDMAGAYCKILDINSTPGSEIILTGTISDSLRFYVYSIQGPDSVIVLDSLVITGQNGYKPIVNGADLDGDGDLDLVLSGSYRPITIYENVNDSLIIVTLSDSIQNADIVIEDFDGDLDLDILGVARYGNEEGPFFLENINQGLSWEKITFPDALPVTEASAVAIEVNGDGKMDLLVIGIVETGGDDGYPTQTNSKNVARIYTNIAPFPDDFVCDVENQNVDVLFDPYGGTNQKALFSINGLDSSTNYVLQNPGLDFYSTMIHQDNPSFEYDFSGDLSLDLVGHLADTAILFSGAHSGMEISMGLPMDNFTIDVWFASWDGLEATVFSNLDTIGGSGIELAVINGDLLVQFYDPSYKLVSTPIRKDLELGKWYHALFGQKPIDEISFQYEALVNGERVWDTLVSQGITLPEESYSYVAYSSPSGFYRPPFQGLINEVSYWNLSPQDLVNGEFIFPYQVSDLGYHKNGDFGRNGNLLWWYKHLPGEAYGYTTPNVGGEGSLFIDEGVQEYRGPGFSSRNCSYTWMVDTVQRILPACLFDAPFEVVVEDAAFDGYQGHLFGLNYSENYELYDLVDPVDGSFVGGPAHAARHPSSLGIYFQDSIQLVVEASPTDTALQIFGSDFVELSNADLYNDSTDLSLELWFKPYGDGMIYSCWDDLSSADHGGIEIGLEKEELTILMGGDKGDFYFFKVPFLEPYDYFTQLTITQKRGDSTKIYLNGEQVAGALNPALEVIFGSSNQFLGKENTASDYEPLSFLPGCDMAVNRLTIWQRELSTIEILDNASAEHLYDDPSVKVKWHYSPYDKYKTWISQVDDNLGLALGVYYNVSDEGAFEMGPGRSSLTCSEWLSDPTWYYLNIPIIDCSFEAVNLVYEPSIDCGNAPSYFSVEGPQAFRAYALEETNGQPHGRIMSLLQPKTQVLISDSLNLQLKGYHSDTAVVMGTPGSHIELISPLWDSALTEMTLEAWVYPTTSVGKQAYFSNSDGVGLGWIMALDAGMPSLTYIDSSGASQAFSVGAIVEKNFWHHVAYSIGNGYIRSFINGIIIDSIPFSGPINFPSSAALLMNSNLPQFSSFTGGLNYFTAWSKAHSGDEIRNNLYKPENPSDPNLEFLYEYYFDHQGSNSYPEVANENGSFFYPTQPQGMQGPGISMVCDEVLLGPSFYSVKGLAPVAACVQEYAINIAIGDTFHLPIQLLDSGSYSPCVLAYEIIADTLPVLCSDDGLHVNFIVRDNQNQRDTCRSTLKVSTFLADTLTWDASPVSVCPGLAVEVPFSGNNGSAVWLRDKISGVMMTLPSTNLEGTLILNGISADQVVELVQTGANSGSLDSGAFILTIPNPIIQAKSLQFSTFFIPNFQDLSTQFIGGLDNDLFLYWNGLSKTVTLELDGDTKEYEVGDAFPGFFVQIGLFQNDLKVGVNGNYLDFIYPGSFPTSVYVKSKPGQSSFSGDLDMVTMDVDPYKVLPRTCSSAAMVSMDFNNPEKPLESKGTLAYNPQTFNDNLKITHSGIPECSCAYVYPQNKAITIFAGGTENAIEKDSIMQCLGDSVLISTNESTLVRWITSGDTASVFSFVADSSRMISVEILDTNSCFAFDSIFVQVNPLPQVVAMNDTLLCQGYPLVFEATGAETYQWSHGFSHGVSNIVPDSVIAVVIGTDSLGCIGSDSAVIQAIPAPVIDDLPIVLNCEPLFVVFNAISTDSIEWSNGIANGDSLFIEETSVFKVSSTNVAGCSVEKTLEIRIEPLSLEAGDNREVCEGQQMQLSATGSAPFVWSNGVSDGQPFTPSEGWYLVYAGFGSTCEVKDSVFVSINPLPVVNAGDDLEICEGNSVSLSANGADTYTWNNGVQNAQAFIPTQSGEFIVEGANQFGCTDLDSLFIRLELIPVVVATIGDASCGTPSGFILLDVTTPDPVTAIWNIGATELNIFDLFPDDYSVEIKSPLGCVFNGTYTVDQLGDYNITFKYGSNTCEGDSTGFVEAFVDGQQNAQNYEVEWRSPGGDILSTGSFLLENLRGGAYWFHAVQNGCLDKKQASLAGGKYIGVKITPLDTNQAGHTISGVGENDGKIRAVISNPFGSFSFEWGNGDTSNLIRGNLGPGKYSILVSSAEGCEFGDSIVLFEPIDLGFPDAFSPNGDELNDFFVIMNIELAPNNTLVVYGVDGEEAYFASPYNNEWGGVMCELNWPDGQYSYVFTANSKTYQGVVLLVREE
ncbi:MAG: gliding motility-associated-like protein [Sphingobacteriales bacterium]